MVDVRCREFNSDIWGYVAENARLRKLSRCEALQQIVLEHMYFMADEQTRRLGGEMTLQMRPDEIRYVGPPRTSEP